MLPLDIEWVIALLWANKRKSINPRIRNKGCQHIANYKKTKKRFHPAKTVSARYRQFKAIEAYYKKREGKALNDGNANSKAKPKKKYLTKNEFRYNTNPEVLRPDGEGHIAYITARRGHYFKINTITHSKTFYDEPTELLSKNPEIGSKDKRPSRFSVPRWQKESGLRERPKGFWRMSKEDRINIKKFNKKYDKKHKK